MKSCLGYALALYVAACLALGLALERHSNQVPQGLVWTPWEEIEFEPAPDFDTFGSTKAKKRAFFNYFLPIVDRENDRVLAQRDIILQIRDWLSAGREATDDMHRILNVYADYYALDSEALTTETLIEQLLMRANAVPRSLTLAQAANESAWGTSRFAVKGNNFFGHWCYRPGCGLIPRQRRSEALHEVRVFESPRDSVRAYIHNINTHPAYEPLRRQRAEALEQGRRASGLELAEGLAKYSERGADYIHEIQRMIRMNKLHDRSLEELQVGIR